MRYVLRCLCAATMLAALVSALAGALTEDYKSRGFRMPDGSLYWTKGEHRPHVDYGCDPNLTCRADLMPPTIDQMHYPIAPGFWIPFVSYRYLDYTFHQSTTRLSDNSLVLHTYYVFGQCDKVGAQIDLEYIPHGNDPTVGVHWIQVVGNNHPVGGQHGEIEWKVDATAPGCPYYDRGGMANSRNFLDEPLRPDGTRDHWWQAWLFLVVESAPNQVTVYDGIAWGWENKCVPEPLTAVIVIVGVLAIARRRAGRT